VLEIALPRSDDAPGLARHALESAFARKMSRVRLADALVVVSELVTNALVHGEGKIVLKADLRGSSLKVEVVDEGTGNAPEVRPESGADGGWGLRIVDSIAHRWGAFEGTTHVWADLPAD
jgi:anti-sigma regulatory factor (Ser/Thr protein kinase)